MDLQTRLATRQDAARIPAIDTPSSREQALVSFEIMPPTVEETTQRITQTSKRDPWFVCDRAGEFVVVASAEPHPERAGSRWSVATAISIKAGRRGSGTARALDTTLLAVFRLQGFARADQGTTLPDPAGSGLHPTMGFEPVGVSRADGFRNGQWLDTAWWQVALQGPMIDPHPALDVKLVRATPAWHETTDAGFAALHGDPAETDRPARESAG